MNLRWVMPISIVAIGLIACTPESDRAAMSAESPKPKLKFKCDAKPLQKYLGQQFTNNIVKQIQQETGATFVRTGNEKDPVTEDYRPDRLNIFYDDRKLITIIECV